MKRTILSLTTAIAFALPATAQTNVEQTVIDVLDANGYPESSFDMLTQGEIATLYLSATSGDANDVADVLAGLNLPTDESSDLFRDTGATSDVELVVRDVLNRNGHDADMIAALSGGDIASIYTAASSGDANAVDEALSSAIEASGDMVEADPSAAERRAVQYLASEGYTESEIDMTDRSELLSIYVALTSGDTNDVDDAIGSALES